MVIPNKSAVDKPNIMNNTNFIKVPNPPPIKPIINFQNNSNDQNFILPPPKNVENNHNTEDIEKQNHDSITSKKTTEKYSGLNNQGMTCYLNSLLQSLFMTPEFRLNILGWKHDESLHGKKEDCIPFQIKKLFAKLQLKMRRAEDTKSLTKSFQWGSSDALYQHDIQELCRILFEAIEISLTMTDKNFINDIFEGFSASVVECQECNFKSLRNDKFLDISLPIRNEFDKIYNNSLEMALSNYLKVEILDKDNKYYCETCQKKVDAKKFIKLEKLPNVLLFQLNRFEYDYVTDSRKKINDKVTFPLILDMNLYTNNNINSVIPNKEYFIKKAEGKIDLKTENLEKEIAQALLNGKEVYELYSIVIHSGTANGGHYYAYIKSFEDDIWYNFNDSDVSEISESEIENVFGGKCLNGFSSATGYVLFYRKIKIESENTKITKIEDTIIEPDMLEEIEEDTKKIIEEELAWKEKLRNITIKIYHDNITKEIIFKKDESIHKMKEKIKKEFFLETLLLEDFKLRVYIKNLDKKMGYVEYEDLSLEENNISCYKIYALEIKNENNEFPVFNENLTEGNLTFWTDEFYYLEKDLFPTIKFEFDKNDTIKDFKKRLLKVTNLENENPDDFYYFRRLDLSAHSFSFIEIFQNSYDQNKSIMISALGNGCKVYMEKKEYEKLPPAEDHPLAHRKAKPSKFLEIIEKFQNEIIIYFNKPESIRQTNKITATSNYKMDYSIRISTRQKISELKKRISEIVNLPENNFIIKKYGPSGPEIKKLSDPINTFTTNDVNIYLELGTPLKEDEILLNLTFLESDFSYFKIYPYKFVCLDKFVVNINKTVKDAKKDFIEFIYNKIGKKIEDEEYLILRECIQDKPAKIYGDDTIFKDIKYLENKNILIQEYKREKLLFNQEDIQISIRLMDLPNWIIDEPIELHVSSVTTYMQLGHMINAYYPNLKPENISLFRIISPININYDTLLSSNNFESVISYMDNKVSEFPYFILHDGNFFFVKDNSIDINTLREPTKDEIEFYFNNKHEASKNKKACSKKYVEFQKNANNVENNNTNNYALVLREDQNRNLDMFKPNSNFTEAKSLLESKFGNKLFNGKHRAKEKNLVITVKKNMQEDREITINQNIDFENKTLLKPNNQDNLPKSNIFEEDNDNDFKCNYQEYSTSNQEKSIIDDPKNYDDYENQDNPIIEPLI